MGMHEVVFLADINYTAGTRQRTDPLEIKLKVKETESQYAIDSWVASPVTRENQKNCSHEGRVKAEIEQLNLEISERQKRIEKLMESIP